MVKADKLKAEVITANKEASGDAGKFVVEVSTSGNLVAAYDQGELLSKEHGLELLKKCKGVEATQITKTFKDYEGQVQYGLINQYKI